MGGQYATWVGTVLDRAHPIVIIAAPGHESEAAIRLGRIGFDHVAGFLTGGMLSVKDRPSLTSTTERISAAVAFERIKSEKPPLVLDVRAPGERAAKSIDGSVSIPLNTLSAHLQELPPDRSLLVHCAGGYRSSLAVSLLQRAGMTNVSEMAGGIAAWEAAGLPVTSPKS